MRRAARNACLLVSSFGLWLLFAPPTFAGEVDWPALVQKPYEHLKAPELGLRPLKTATKAEWDRDRQRIKNAWQERLGTAPAVPDELDIKIEKTEKLDGYTRQLLSFHSEGDDRIAALAGSLATIYACAR